MLTSPCSSGATLHKNVRRIKSRPARLVRAIREKVLSRRTARSPAASLHHHSHRGDWGPVPARARTRGRPARDMFNINSLVARPFMPLLKKTSFPPIGRQAFHRGHPSPSLAYQRKGARAGLCCSDRRSRIPGQGPGHSYGLYARRHSARRHSTEATPSRPSAEYRVHERSPELAAPRPCMLWRKRRPHCWRRGRPTRATAGLLNYLSCSV